MNGPERKPFLYGPLAAGSPYSPVRSSLVIGRFPNQSPPFMLAPKWRRSNIHMIRTLDMQLLCDTQYIVYTLSILRITLEHSSTYSTDACQLDVQPVISDQQVILGLALHLQFEPYITLGLHGSTTTHFPRDKFRPPDPGTFTICVDAPDHLDGFSHTGI
ncbi:hypothetical protein NDU88_002353 [Pleurodeles waltl]|uniref:Uncharacterized protein n=1 Tax=Pleurodeles waltl TaxID=8319 RepID=A0AAV7MX55_PLEWA|nr:hypothetical protein NDU88_002353 [Pleurodeles waltl]